MGRQERGSVALNRAYVLIWGRCGGGPEGRQQPAVVAGTWVKPHSPRVFGVDEWIAYHMRRGLPAAGFCNIEVFCPVLEPKEKVFYF